MYSYGDEFTFTIDDDLEYFTTIGTIKIKENEYVIAENEYGLKKVFLVDEDEEELYLADEEDEEMVLEAYDKDLDEDSPTDYSDIDDEYEYEAKFISKSDAEDELDGFIEEDLDVSHSDDFDDEEFEIDIDDYLNDLFDEEYLYDN